MPTDKEIDGAREAHRRALAKGCRPTRSNDNDSKLLRKHRLAHNWNVTHYEECEKRAVPTALQHHRQKPIDLMGESDA